MGSGGARARSGLPPDPNALKRDRDSAEWINLPAEGRQGPVPGWPLSKATARELELWEREWKRPQAIVWEANGQFEEVALYVRTLRKAEQPKAATNVGTLVKQQMEALGISIPGMLRNRWRIGVGSTEAKAAQPEGPTAKERLKLVSGGSA